MKIAMLAADNREHFKDYGAEVPSFGAPDAVLHGLAQCPEIELHVISCAQMPLACPERLAPNIFFHGLHVTKIGWLRTAYLGCTLAIRRALKQIQPQLVHGEGTERYCALSAAYSGYPNVVTLHGNMRAIARGMRARIGSFNWWAARLEKIALSRTGGVFCNSSYTEAQAKPVARRTWRVPNALAPEFLIAPPVQSPRDVPLLINVGTVTPYKRQCELIESMGRLHAKGLPFVLQFVGRCGDSTAYERKFRERIRIAEQKGYARYLGSVPGSDVVQLLDTSSALVHVPTEEAFGLAVAEGLARNLKFFGSRTGGVPDIAAGVEMAELFDKDDWTGLEDRIAQWIRAGCPTPASAAAEMKQRYAPLKIARRHIEIYREVLGISPTEDPASLRLKPLPGLT